MGDDCLTVIDARISDPRQLERTNDDRTGSPQSSIKEEEVSCMSHLHSKSWIHVCKFKTTDFLTI